MELRTLAITGVGIPLTTLRVSRAPLQGCGYRKRLEVAGPCTASGAGDRCCDDSSQLASDVP